MARIPDDEIERLKKEVSLERLVEAHGVILKRHGKDLFGLCPFHNDTDPSLVVTPDKNVWHCLGACQTGGSVIDWVMKAHGVLFRHAVEILKSDQMPAAPTRLVKTSTVPKLPAPVDLTADDQALIKQVVGFYHETLKKSPEALAYLKARGITSAEIIERFQIGFANRTLGLRLPDKNRKAGNEIRTRLQNVGILRKETGHEHFNGSIVIPVVDEQGNVLEMYGRKITPHLRAGTPDHLYLPGPHHGVFNVEALARYREIILCEALIDALTFLNASFPNVTASYGTNGFTPDHWAAFRKFKTQRVLIAYDRDDAGEKATLSLAEKLMASGIECFRIQFPRGMDANEYALKVQPAAKSLGLVIRKAVWLGKGPAPDRSDAGPRVEVIASELATPPDSPAPPIQPSPSPSLAAEVAMTPAAVPSTPEFVGCPPITPISVETLLEGQTPVPMYVSPVPSAARVSEAVRTSVPASPAPESRLPASPNPRESSQAPLIERTPTPATTVVTAAAAASVTVRESPAPAAARIPGLVHASVPASPATEVQPPASPNPPAPPPPTPLERQGQDVRVLFADRQYRIRGLAKNGAVGPLKVDMLVTRGDHFHQDTFNLSVANQRVAYMREAARELGVADDVIKKDLGHILRALEDLQDEQRKTALEPKKPEVKITPEDRDEALELLRDPRLLNRILEGFHRGGVVGEETNLLVGYLAAVSRLLDTPLAVVIQSSSAAGKSSLMEAILAFLPSEHRVKYSAMTGQSLFYMGSTDLRHKVLAIVEEEGAERASYALKLLQSEGELTIASTGKDPATGRHVTHEYRVEGPVMIFLTTTAVEIDEELLNRCVILSVNEEREQTRIIHQQQRERETLEGQLTRRDVSRIVKRHQNAQRLLRPLLVANPHALKLTFRDDQTRMRRDHGKYLTLIRAVTLLHQYQRPVQTVEHDGQKIEYIEVSREDICVANRLAHEVLGRSLDELPPQTRRLLQRLHGWVGQECERLSMSRLDFRFQRKDLRALTGCSEPRARVHLDKLVALEYVVVHRGARGQSFVYELIYDGQGEDGQPFLMGLIDPDALEQAHGYDKKFVGSEGQFVGEKDGFVGSSSPHRRPIVASSSGGGNGSSAASDQGFGGGASKTSKNTVLDSNVPIVSYPHDRPLVQAPSKDPQ